MRSGLISSFNRLRLLAAAQRRLRFSGERLAEVQLSMLQRVLRHAYERVPLYREKFEKAGVEPGDLRTLGDLGRFPMTEKDEVRDAFPVGCVASGTDLSACRIQPTSGSSGQCMEIALDARSDDARAVFTQRVYGMHGFRFWRRMAYLFPYELPLRRNLGLYRNRHISTQLPPRQVLAELRAWRPQLLAATPSDLFEICEALDDDLRELRLRAVCVHSEPLSRDERRHLEQRFGCPVSANYYCNEVWAIGGECRHGALHQFADSVLVEIVDESGRPLPRGEVGNVLVTSLHNRVQPFIRYRLGDLASWETAPEPCACGLSLPRLRSIEGRDDDYLEHPDGRRIHPSKLTVAVKSPCFAYPGAQVYRDYRITQDGPAHVTVQVVAGRDRQHLDLCIRRARQNLVELLGPRFEVEIKQVSALARGPGGKRKIVERLAAGAAR